MRYPLRTPEEQDKEATLFACALLMPREPFVNLFQDLEKTIKDEDKLLKQIAKQFQVPVFAVAIRLQMINSENTKL